MRPSIVRRFLDDLYHAPAFGATHRPAFPYAYKVTGGGFVVFIVSDKFRAPIDTASVERMRQSLVDFNDSRFVILGANNTALDGTSTPKLILGLAQASACPPASTVSRPPRSRMTVRTRAISLRTWRNRIGLLSCPNEC